MNRRNISLLLGALILLGGAGYLFARMRRPAAPAHPPVPVVCTECGTEFEIKSNDEVPVCPNCGSTQTLRRLYFRCTECGHVFVAFECDAEHQTVRRPGGEWMPREDCSFEATCPECQGRAEFVPNVRGLRK